MPIDYARSVEAMRREERDMDRDHDAPCPAMMQMSAPALLCLDENSVVVNLPAGSIVTIRIPED